MNVVLLSTLKSSILLLTLSLTVEASFILKPGYIATTGTITSKIRYHHQNVNLLPFFYCRHRDGRVIRSTKNTSFQKRQDFFKVFVINDVESQATQKDVENGKKHAVCDFFNVPMRMKLLGSS
jgi:hypothetical protein